MMICLFVCSSSSPSSPTRLMWKFPVLYQVSSSNFFSSVLFTLSTVDSFDSINLIENCEEKKNYERLRYYEWMNEFVQDSSCFFSFHPFLCCCCYFCIHFFTNNNNNLYISIIRMFKKSFFLMLLTIHFKFKSSQESNDNYFHVSETKKKFFISSIH